MRSEQSDEQAAEQLQEVKHPKARIADRGICASPDTIFGSHRGEHTARIAVPLSLRKSAIVLKSGASRPVSHISSILRGASRSSRRLDCARLRYRRDRSSIASLDGTLGAQ